MQDFPGVLSETGNSCVLVVPAFKERIVRRLEQNAYRAVLILNEDEEQRVLGRRQFDAVLYSLEFRFGGRR